jgi:hypothetical protein
LSNRKSIVNKQWWYLWSINWTLKLKIFLAIQILKHGLSYLRSILDW